MERWKELQPHLRKMLGEDEYATWIDPLKAVASDERSLTLTSDNSIVTDWVRDHLLRDIETVARGHFGSSYRVEIAASVGAAKRSTVAAAAPFATHPIHPGFTFDRFVVGPSNQFATAAAEAVADRPGEAYNPLYIYGGSGLGKTHLLHAIAHRVDERYKRRKN